MKSVCVIGGGPGGLVTAKTLLEARCFEVTVYEQEDRLGGLWKFGDDECGNRYLSAATPTNLSRYTVAFSDLAWESVPLRDKKLSLFPRAAQVGEYLDEYAKRYISDGIIQYNRRVTSAELVSDDSSGHWKVTTATKSGQEVATFDYLVNAAGFFSAPGPLEVEVPRGIKTTVTHSSSFKSLADLFPEPSTDVRNTAILVVGGGNSGGEAAASIAFQLSDARYSPTHNQRERYENVRVWHVSTRHLYAIPPFIPSSSAPTYAPLDFQFYNLKWRPSDIEIKSSSGSLPHAGIQTRHQLIQGMVGDQRDLNASALETDADYEARVAPYAALSETYPEFVRQKSILPVRAKWTGACSESTTPWLTCQAESLDGSAPKIANVSAIVYATGYTPEPAVSFFSPSVKEKLEFDTSTKRLPVLLQNWQTLNPSVPNLGFVGFYEGPYWAVMEMQARILTRLWSAEPGPSHTKPLPSSEPGPSQPEPLPFPKHEALPALRGLRKAMQQGDPAVPQYWFSDYAAYLEEVSLALGLERNDAPFAHTRDGPVSPSRYLSADVSDLGRREARRAMHSLRAGLVASQEGRYRARAVFRGMQGRWALRRVLASARPDMPSGEFGAEAWFHPRKPTRPEYDGEYLYVEAGVFRTDAGAEMRARRSYVYRYCEARDELSVWFVKVDDALAVDYLFHKLSFAPLAPRELAQHTEQLPLRASADHLCESDLYDTACSFVMHAVALRSFEVKHVVRGPAKDYVATAQYRR